MIKLGSFFSTLLLPLSYLWSLIYRLRRFFYHFGFFKQNYFRVPIVSIGNLTFGGTGKTPFTLWLANYLNERQKSVMILMRGYKGKLEHSSGILKSGKKLGYNPFDFGDEALLLARHLKKGSVVVGKNRSENLDFYFEQEKPDVVLLEDGHQHLKLYRSCNIVLFDSLMPLDRYKVAPLGYMREGFSSLKDAHLVVLGRADQVEKEKLIELKNLLSKYLNPNTPIAEFCYRPIGFFNMNHIELLGMDEIKGRKVICVAGVANPESFFNLIESLGANVVNRYQFADHYFFTSEDMQKIMDEITQEDALLVTTEKDIVKMKRVVDDSRICYLEIQVEFLSGIEKVEEIISQTIRN